MQAHFPVTDKKTITTRIKNKHLLLKKMKKKTLKIRVTIKIYLYLK